MRFNSFLPVAAITAVSATMLAVSAPAQAQVTGRIDLVGQDLVNYTNNSLGFSGAAPTSGAFGTADVVFSTPTLSSFYAPGSTTSIFDVTTFSPATEQLLLSNGSGVDFFYNSVTRSNTGMGGLEFDFTGFFQGPGVARTNATFSVLTAQTGMMNGAPAEGASSYSLTILADNTTPVPEPSAFGGLVAFGLLGAGVGLKRRQKQTV
ncbi:MAG TPA: hypothetical protein V6D12_21895 [Candidatus Obscuribacterales bacterium]